MLRRRRTQGRESERRALGGQEGTSLLELMMAVTVLVTVLMGFAKVVVSSMATSSLNDEAAVATAAGQRTLERLRDANFEDIFAMYNASTADDPPGVVSPGPDFAVAGLQAQVGDADGLVGEVLFPVAAGALRENIADLAFGTPRDLNGDGDEDGLDHSDDYRILPVVVRLQWRGKKGPASVELKTLLADY